MDYMDPLVRSLFERYLGMGRAPEQPILSPAEPQTGPRINMPPVGQRPPIDARALALKQPVWAGGMPPGYESEPLEPSLPEPYTPVAGNPLFGTSGFAGPPRGDILLSGDTPNLSARSAAMEPDIAISPQTKSPTTELPYQTYQRLTGNQWTGGGSETILGLMRRLGVEGKPGAASTNLALQRAMLREYNSE